MITVVGSGRVGSATAFRIASLGLDDVTLVDVVEGLPRGEALDISQSCLSGVRVRGSSDFSDMRGSDVVINTAGMARRPGMDRLDLMRKNADITRSVARNVKSHAPGAVVIQVANPVDLMALVMLRETGFPRERVFGMGGMLDSQRFRYFISEETGVSPLEVEAMVMGEHGNGMVPIASLAKAGGKPLAESADAGKVARILDRTRKAGMEVIELKGSTFYAPSVAVAAMAEAVVKDSRKVMPSSVFLKGEYGASGVFAGVPARLGRSGVIEVVELGIDAGEKESFLESCEALKGKAKELGL